MSTVGSFPRPSRAARVPWAGGSSSGVSLRGVSLLLVGTILSFGVGWFWGAHNGGSQRGFQLQLGSATGGGKGSAPTVAGGSSGGWTLDAAVKQAAADRKRLADKGAQKPPSYKPLVALVVTKCENTCPMANNGVCDEGRRLLGTAPQAVKCDLGTDCADCGPYTGPMYPSSRWPEGGPVAHLLKRGVSVMTTMTVSIPPFQVVFTDPKQDLDVSSGLDRDQLLESGITQLFYEVLAGRCNTTQDVSKRALVLDVGANFGYFAAYAAKLGCRVVAWEPIPHFQAFVYQVLMMNNVTDLVMMRERVVTEEDGAVVPMQAPTKGIWGTASIMGINQNADQAPADFSATSERLDSVVQDDVLLMKVDVEGFESSVIKSANRLFTTKDVKNLVLEYNPGVAEGSADDPRLSHLVTANPLMLMELLFRGYRIGLMIDGVAKPGWPYHRYGLKIPELPEITTDILRHDLDDAHEYVKAAQDKENRNHGVRCPPDPTLLELNPKSWAVCNLFPEDAHPQGARSYFPYNTNLWISKEDDKLKLKGVVGVLETWQDPNSIWSNPEQEFVTGQRSCKYLPLDTMVRNRCSCNWAVKRNMSATDVHKCRTEEAAVLAALKLGRIKYKA